MFSVHFFSLHFTGVGQFGLSLLFISFLLSLRFLLASAGFLPCAPLNTVAYLCMGRMMLPLNLYAYQKHQKPTTAQSNLKVSWWSLHCSINTLRQRLPRGLSFGKVLSNGMFPQDSQSFFRFVGLWCFVQLVFARILSVVIGHATGQCTLLAYHHSPARHCVPCASA